jgi:multicomponent K+:H+ antiporter subunit G
MTEAADLPVWAAALIGFLVVLGAGFTVVGAIGLLRLRTFYERMHAPTLGATWGAAGILLGSIVFFSIVQSRPVLHEVLIAIFVTMTTPVTLMLLARAAVYRDRTEGSRLVPPPIGGAGRAAGTDDPS